MAIVIAVTLPVCWDAVSIEASKLVRLAALPCVLNAVFAVIGQVPLAFMRTLALWANWTCRLG